MTQHNNSNWLTVFPSGVQAVRLVVLSGMPQHTPLLLPGCSCPLPLLVLISSFTPALPPTPSLPILLSSHLPPPTHTHLTNNLPQSQKAAGLPCSPQGCRPFA